MTDDNIKVESTNLTEERMDNLTLRIKACEALGWKKDRWQAAVARPSARDWYHTPKCPSDIFSESCDAAGHVDALQLPAIESDPAVSEPLFLAWLGSDRSFVMRDWFKDVQQTIRTFEIEIHYSARPMISAEGETPSEARARAICKATEKRLMRNDGNDIV